MTAQEARELTKRVISDKTNKEVEEVYKTINTAISRGEYRCHFFKPLSSEALEQLENDGYKVDEIHGARDGDISHTIKWCEYVKPAIVIESSSLKAVLDKQEFKTDRTS